MRRIKEFLSVFAIVMLLLHAGGTVAVANEHGNNGDVKTHEGAGEPSPIEKDQPQVCTFHIHGLKFDANSSGTWDIEGQGGDKVAGPSTADGTWKADASGNWRSPEAGALSCSMASTSSR